MVTNSNISKLIFFSSLIFFFTSSTLTAQKSKIDFPEKSLKNYLIGAQSENLGLKSSCIYFIGKYQIEEAEELLLREISNCKDENIKFLSAWCLYMIGNKRCMEELKKLSGNDECEKFSSFCSMLCLVKGYDFVFAQRDNI